MPARNLVKYASITLTANEVMTAGSFNDWALGSDSAPVLTSEGVTSPQTALLTASDLTAFERAAREAKAGILTTISIESDAIVLTPNGDAEIVAKNYALEADCKPDLERYRQLRKMLAAVELRTGVIPGHILISRGGILSKFEKVKTDNKDHALDLAFTDEYYPVMVKCGPTFKGMFAPIEPETFATNVDVEGLW